MFSLKLFLVLAALAVSSQANADCQLFHPSDGQPPANKPPSPAESLNEAFPTTAPTGEPAWRQSNFKTDPQAYAEIFRALGKATINITGGKIQINKQQWWSVPFMNYTNNGREHYNGLTKERSPKKGDLALNSPDTAQLWAVGWYNAYGAVQIGKIWRNPCQPDTAAASLLPEHTVSLKLLFTNMPTTAVTYLQGSPEIPAAIDPVQRNDGFPPSERVQSTVRLLQVDFAVKDNRAAETGWVFGTFAWMGPATGDGLWDNLRLVGLHWGNDPGKTSGLLQSYINNPVIQGQLYGWADRPFMGFLGRVNGPADNKASSCLSCHSRAQLPRAPGGIVGGMPRLNDKNAVRRHLDRYFQNVAAGVIAAPVTNAIPFDYSLQVMNAFERQCAACAVGDIHGPVASVCKLVQGTATLTKCASGQLEAFSNISAAPALRALIAGSPPRQ